MWGNRDAEKNLGDNEEPGVWQVRVNACKCMQMWAVTAFLLSIPLAKEEAARGAVLSIGYRTGRSGNRWFVGIW